MEYYSDIKALKGHLAHDHFLCTHEDCNQEGSKEYSVFLTENELQSHMQMEHQGGKMGGKSRVKLQITGAASGSEHDRRQHDGGRGGRGGGRGGRGSSYYYNDRHLARGVDLIEEEEQGVAEQLTEAMESFQVEDFPTLGQDNDDGAIVAPARAAPVYQSLQTQLQSEQSFPTLGGRPV